MLLTVAPLYMSKLKDGAGRPDKGRNRCIAACPSRPRSVENPLDA